MAKTTITAKLGLDTTAFQRGMSRSQKSVSKFAKGATASFIRLGAAFAGIGLVKSIVGLGLAAGETASKFNAVFGPAADKMNKRVQELRKTIPSTTAEMQNALATFANMATAMGLTETAANQFSVEMVKIAGDLASFHDLRIEDAFLKIRSAISGEFEPMKQLGIVINEARIKQEGLNIGINEGTKQLSAGQKALIVQSILIKDMGIANGDAALTAKSAANQVKFLQKNLKETGTEIGTTMIPAIVLLVGAFASIVKGAKGASEAVGTFAGKLVYGDATREEAVAQLKLLGITQKSIGHAREFEKLVEQQIRFNALKAKNEKKAAEQKRKSDEEAIRLSKDTASELEDQIKKEIDPERKKALEERLKAFRDILKAVGDINSLAMPILGGTSGGTSSTGGGGGRTGQSVEQAKKEARKRGIRFETVRGSGGSTFQQRFVDGKKAGKFSEAELASAAAKRPQAKDPAQEAAAQTKALESIEREIKKNPS